MLNANLFVFACAGLLDIKTPIEIRMTTGKFNGPKNAAAYMMPHTRKGKITKFVVYINLRVCVESEYNISEVISHEICHAAQFEHGIFNPEYHHDKKFQKLCKYLEKECTKIGFPISNLYNPETDKD